MRSLHHRPYELVFEGLQCSKAVKSLITRNKKTNTNRRGKLLRFDQIVVFVTKWIHRNFYQSFICGRMKQSTFSDSSFFFRRSIQCRQLKIEFLIVRQNRTDKMKQSENNSLWGEIIKRKRLVSESSFPQVLKWVFAPSSTRVSF